MKKKIKKLNRYKEAYSQGINYMDYIQYIAGPGMFLGVFSFLLWYRVSITLFMFIIGCIYGYRYIFPKVIYRLYRLNSLSERNKFINNVTQILMDDNKTVLKALQIVLPRLKGEFKDDISRLSSRIQGANSIEVTKAFNVITDKYKNDPIFFQFCEQLESAIIEEKNNTNILKQIKKYHNDLKFKTDQFINKKNEFLSDLKQLIFLAVILILVLTFSTGYDSYLNAFGHSAVGLAFGGLYFLLVNSFLHSFFKNYFKDDVMSI